ncbi:MAG: peptidase, partial [Candidatus Acidiferrum sp.]
EVLDNILTATWKSPRETGYEGEISRVVASTVLYGLMSLATNEKASTQSRAIASLKLDELKTWATRSQTGFKDPEERAHLYFAAQQITQFQKDPKLIPFPAPAQPPDGPPIGDDEENWLP